MNCQFVVKTVPDEVDGGTLIKICGQWTVGTLCATHEALLNGALFGPEPYVLPPRKPLRTLYPRRVR